MNATIIPTEFKPPRDVGTFTTKDRDERAARDEQHHQPPPARPLGSQDLKDLEWYFWDVEAEMGVHTTFGAQLERAAAQRTADECREQATHARREARKRLRLSGRGQSVVQALGGDTVLLAHLTGEFIYQHSAAHTTQLDPFDSDDVIDKAVPRARRVRWRLHRIGGHAEVLRAVYGPREGGDVDLSTRSADGKRAQAHRQKVTKWTLMERLYGDLGGIVLAVARAMMAERQASELAVYGALEADARATGDLPAVREAHLAMWEATKPTLAIDYVLARADDVAFRAEMRTEALEHLRAAGHAYASAHLEVVQ